MGPNDEKSTRAAHRSTTKHRYRAAGVALALGTTRRHVQRLVTERRIPFVKVGRFVRFDPAELGLWLDAQRVAPVPRPSRYGSS